MTRFEKQFSLPDYKNIYTLLPNIYKRILNQNTSFSTIKLVGKFAKNDYLLKEKSSSKELIHIINDFRIRTNNIGKYSIDELNNLAFKLCACMFIRVLFLRVKKSKPPK